MQIVFFSEHCQLTEWTDLVWSKEVAGQKCGVGTKTRKVSVTAKHYGDSCDKRYGCSGDACTTATETKDCPGMYRLHCGWILLLFVKFYQMIKWEIFLSIYLCIKLSALSVLLLGLFL